MIILILGANGNLGGQLVKVFDIEDNEVIAWDKSEIDITDRELILKKVGDIKPNVIINAAAYNSVDKCEDNDEEYELAKSLNIDGPKYLAEASLKNNAIFVHYSTDYVFEGNKKKGYKETDEPKPVNRYGKSKFYGEKRILELSGSGLKWYLIRTSKLFGPKGRSPLVKPSFFDQMFDLSEKRNEFEVVNDELSCFTYTADLAQATKKLLESDKGYGVYHLVNSSPVTWYDAAKYLFELTKKNVKIIPVSPERFPRVAKRPKYSVLLNTKFDQLRPWTEALKEHLSIKN